MAVVLEKNQEVLELINSCKSSTKLAGYQLRNAHFRFGVLLGELIAKKENFKNKKVAVIAMMRAGLCIGEGVAEAIEKAGNNVEIIFSYKEPTEFSSFDAIIIADAVINTGKSLFEYMERNKISSPILVTGVIAEKNLSLFENYNLYAARVSGNSYVGTENKTVQNGKGPDTGDRLFYSGFFID